MSNNSEQDLSNINVLFVGQSGVGKSSLINYVFNETLRKTGTGKPVTEPGFEAEYKVINGVPVTLIDSWGLEQGKDVEWGILLSDFLQKRGIEKKVEEWVHVAVFCINASSNRIQDLEVNIIKNFMNNGIEVVIALTKAAICSEETIQEMISVLRDEVSQNLVIVPVNSKAEKLMSGTEIQTCGRDEIVEAMKGNYIGLLKRNLPKRILWLLNNKIENYGEKIKECKNTSAAEEAVNIYCNLYWEKDVNEIIFKELIESAKLYVNVQTISMTVEEVKLQDGYKDILKGIGGGAALAGIGLGVGVAVANNAILGAFLGGGAIAAGGGAAAGAVLAFSNPIGWVILGGGAITGGILAITKSQNRPIEISEAFVTQMKDLLNERAFQLEQEIINRINSLGELMNTK